MCGSCTVHVDSVCVLVRKREQVRNTGCVYVRACVCGGNLRRCITYSESVTMSVSVIGICGICGNQPSSREIPRVLSPGE